MLQLARNEINSKSDLPHADEVLKTLLTVPQGEDKEQAAFRRKIVTVYVRNLNKPKRIYAWFIGIGCLLFGAGYFVKQLGVTVDVKPVKVPVEMTDQSRPLQYRTSSAICDCPSP